MVKIGVTGGCGYVGDVAVEALLKNQFEVSVLDNLMYGGAYLRPGVDFLRGDIRDESVVGEFVSNCDGIIHLAAIVGDGACAQNPDLTTAVNEQATKNIAKFCREQNKPISFASTCSVYGANSSLLDEESSINPISLYAGTKRNAEDFISTVRDHYIFRLGTLYGLSGPFGRLRTDLVVNILTLKAALEGKISVYGGSQWRPLLSVKDAGETLAYSMIQFFTAHKEESHPKDYIMPFGVYNLYSKNYKIIDIAKVLASVFNKDIEVEVTEQKFEDLRNYRVTSCRMSGWGTKRTLCDGVKEIKELIESGRVANIWSDLYHNANYVKNNDR